jgi:phage tail-like protein
MTPNETYLRYLPPVVWEHEPLASSISLKVILRVFEKLLTGIHDNTPAHEPIAAIIDRLPQLFDPQQTPSEFLPWLSSWVGLTLPAEWDNDRRRRAILKIMSIYRQRGSREGLARLLNLFAAGPLKPRIDIDEGTRLFAGRLRGQGLASLFSLVSQGPYVKRRRRQGPDGEEEFGDVDPVFEGLVRPKCIAIAPDDGSLFIGDGGNAAQPFLPARLWHLSASGEYDHSREDLKPQPVRKKKDPGPGAEELILPSVVAVVIRNNDSYEAWLLDGNGNLYRIEPGAFLAELSNFKLAQQGTEFKLVAMAVDTSHQNDLLVLDRGTGDMESAARPSILIQNVEGAGALRRVRLHKVVEPLSLAILPNGDLIIGEGGQTAASPEDVPTPGNLILVDRSNDASWVETPLLPGDRATNPLTSPVSLAIEASGSVLVLDRGLKPATPSKSNPFVAEIVASPAVYRINLRTKQVTLAAIGKQLVYPEAMAVANELIYVCDPGPPGTHALAPNWRVGAQSFGIVLHYPRESKDENPKQRLAAQRQLLGSIRDVVDRETPAQSMWTLHTQEFSST